MNLFTNKKNLGILLIILGIVGCIVDIIAFNASYTLAIPCLFLEFIGIALLMSSNHKSWLG